MKSKLAFIIAFSFFPLIVHGAGISFSLSSAAPLVGDTLVVTLASGQSAVKSATFGGEPVTFFAFKGKPTAVVGIPPTKTPGYYRLRINLADGATAQRLVQVKKRLFPKVVLGIPEELGLTPEGLVTKLATEKVDLEKILSVRTPAIYFASFGLPLLNNTLLGSVFGEIRQTGNTEIRHLGIDLSAPLGTAVGAIAGGIVKKAYVDSVYGNSIVIDHGEGIYSLYLHLNEMKVKEGDRVGKGTTIGTVGQTGYATAPHLHLSVKVGDMPVDPIRFVRAMGGL